MSLCAKEPVDLASYVQMNTIGKSKPTSEPGLIMFTSANDAVMVCSLFKKTIDVVHLLEITIPAQAVSDGTDFEMQWVAPGNALCTYWMILPKNADMDGVLFHALAFLKKKGKCFATSRCIMEVQEAQSTTSLKDVTGPGESTRQVCVVQRF